MVYTLNPTLAKNVYIRILGILGFAVLTAIGAQISIPRQPVPITMQVLMVLMAGLTLGPKDGAASIMVYLSAIVMNFPVAAEGMGAAALTGPTAGYLYSFPIAAWITGTLAVQNHWLVRWLAGMAAVLVIYIMGTTYLKAFFATNWENAWLWGVKPFILIDIAKAAVAAAMGESARFWWKNQLKG